MIAELVGTHASVAGPAAQICERAAGNPFFTEEIVRDLAERRVLTGEPGHYLCRRGVADVSVTATARWRGAGRRPPRWFNCFSVTAAARSDTRRRPRSTGSHPYPSTPGSSCTDFRYFDCGHCWRRLAATTQHTVSMRGANARWRHHLASKDISRSPMLWHDIGGGAPRSIGIPAMGATCG